MARTTKSLSDSDDKIETRPRTAATWPGSS